MVIVVTPTTACNEHCCYANKHTILQHIYIQAIYIRSQKLYRRTHTLCTRLPPVNQVWDITHIHHKTNLTQPCMYCNTSLYFYSGDFYGQWQSSQPLCVEMDHTCRV